MSLILNIETATKNCSVSLAENGKIIALKEVNDGGYSHAENLHVFVQDVLKEVNMTLKNVDAVAVSKGPGSFTGLRIGVSTVKGLCYALDIPLISTSTLQALALQVTKEKGLVIPMLDARRMEVYSAVFNTDNSLVREIQAQVLDENSFATYLENNDVYFIGDGVSKTKEIITHKNAFFIDDKLPSANEMAQLSFDKFQQKDFEDVAYFEPFYLKDFVTNAKKK
ncbi:MAG: tRNA (adenosine(37)-N6)-threonylcarbamoyltransferase complex dimerization subunit type 1 TsaB [Lutibacter sp.]|nr:MAG: tRNA (adenosine(37)-N6)-threonylcarbamoyltransferase complex dimerization subunit type 1 TsaB [Lutibacter sp.]